VVVRALGYSVEPGPVGSRRRVALDLDPNLPIVNCDARSRESAKQVLIALVEHVMMGTGGPVVQ
jgi:uncharacterized protein